MTKAAADRQQRSAFCHELCDIVLAWDVCLYQSDRASALV